MDKLTHKEHMARAMLMGLVYDWADGSYCEKSGQTPGSIDCITLQPLTNPDLVRRWKENGSPPNYDAPPTRETPWARMDDDGTGQETN